MEVLQTSALPLGDGAPLTLRTVRLKADPTYVDCTKGMGSTALKDRTTAFDETRADDRGHKLFGPPSRLRRYGGQLSPDFRAKVGAGNGIRTRDFDLGKVALYH
jgi:hypothetical protein